MTTGVTAATTVAPTYYGAGAIEGVWASFVSCGIVAQSLIQTDSPHREAGKHAAPAPAATAELK